jgi:hypothetical protein
MLVKLFNFAVIVIATLASAYGCYFLLAFVWRALKSGNLLRWNYSRSAEPGKYWRRLSWLLVLGIGCGAAAVGYRLLGCSVSLGSLDELG